MSYIDPDRQREYQRDWIARRRQEWIKDNGPCIDCGSWDNLEVDHVDRSTKVTHNVWSWTKVRRDEELAKCVVRCSPCHRIRTIQQLQTKICWAGHDKDVVGRDGGGECSECRRERHRKYRREGRKK